MTNTESRTTLRGMDALQSALRDPSIPIFRERLTGRLERVDLRDAAEMASRGRYDRLVVELPA